MYLGDLTQTRKAKNFAISSQTNRAKTTTRSYRDPEASRQNRKRLQKKYRDNLRASVIAALGSSCVGCGFSDIRALQVDHINGGGRQERIVVPSVRKYYKMVLQSIIEEEGKYQLLCANCNWIKKVVNNEHNG